MNGYAVRRGLFTLIGLAGAGALLWVASRFDRHTTGGYWAAYGVIAGAGVAIVLSQLFGGWTKDGWPRASESVFLLGFLPALVVFGWVLAAGQPHGNTVRGHVDTWSHDLHANGLVNDLRQFLPAVAFLVGLALALVFDTTGRRAVTTVTAETRFEPAIADAPLTRERTAVSEPAPGSTTRITPPREPAGL